LAFDPSSDFHEYRFDWYPDRVDFYIDGSLAKSLSTNIPQKPGRFMFSHWTDGNAKFSQGPPATDAFMEIKSIVAVFNTSIPTTNQSYFSTGGTCQKSQTSCTIPGKQKKKKLNVGLVIIFFFSEIGLQGDPTSTSPTNESESTTVSSSSGKTIQLQMGLVALVMVGGMMLLK
jgi:beta-glucanase (GH16 family)